MLSHRLIFSFLLPLFAVGCPTSPTAPTPSEPPSLNEIDPGGPSRVVAATNHDEGDSLPAGDARPGEATAAKAGTKAGVGGVPRVEGISRVEAQPGLVIERHRASAPSPAGVGDRVVTVVRVDPERFQLRLLTAHSDGRARTVPRWMDDFDLTGGINASMFLRNHRSTGLMIRRGKVNNDRDNPLFGGILAFDPRRPSSPPLAVYGRDCPGYNLDKIRARYRTVIQNYRMLDCQGQPIAWADRKAYSAAAIGTDRRGWFVMVHSRTPYRMTTFNRMLGTPELELASMMYVEGGPEATLVVRAGEHQVQEIGSWETAFNEADDNREFWPIPNVIGFSPRDS